MSVNIKRIRKAFLKNDTKRDQGLTTPEEIERYDDIAYGEDEMQVLDVYRPKDKVGKLPVIVSVHGGGWVYGNKEIYQYYCMDLSKRGFAVVNFSYRLSPEFRWPCQLEDTDNVFRWVYEHKDEYGFDTENLFGVGDSAGGHLLSLYACLLTNEKMREEYGFTVPEEISLKALGLNCGAYRMEREDEELMKVLFGRKPEKEDLRKISPVNYVTEKFPPSFVMTAEKDFLKEDALLMKEKLEEAGTEVRYVCYEDEKERPGHVFHVNIRSPLAKRCNDEECGFFKEHMK